MNVYRKLQQILTKFCENKFITLQVEKENLELK